MKSPLPHLALGLCIVFLAACQGPERGGSSSTPSFKVEVPVIDLTDDLWDGHAISYSGFRQGQRPGGAYPSDEEILEDLKLLERNWNLIRFYNTDTHGEAVLRVIREQDLGLKVMMGIYLFKTKDLEGAAFAANDSLNRHFMAEGLRLAREYADLLVGINVGNEALVSWSFVPNPVETMIGYIRHLRRELQEAGLDIPLTVADNYAFWQTGDGARVAEELDFVAVHGYSMWDGIGIEGGIEFLDSQVAAVRANLPGKPLIVAETGWTTYAEDAQIYGKIGPQANEENQQLYFDQVTRWARGKNVTTMLFEAFDEPWKGNGNDGAAEGHWGVFDVNRNAKRVMHRYYPERVTKEPTSPSYEGFEFTPLARVQYGFRSETVEEFTIDTVAEALSSCTVRDTAAAFEGDQALLFTHDGTTWGGFYSVFDPGLDLTGKDEIRFALRNVPPEAAYFELKLEGGGEMASVNVLSYAPVRHGGWQLYSIPLSDFAPVDLSQVNILGFWHPFKDLPYDDTKARYVKARILIDDIHFE